MGRIKFVRVGNPFIAFLSIAIIALVLWLYVKCNPTPIQFRYNINDDSSGLIIHEYKATNGCSFVKEHNGLILIRPKDVKTPILAHSITGKIWPIIGVQFLFAPIA